MPQSWIQPQQNSFLDTFAQAEQLKNYRSANALNEAKVADLPYAREREEALNVANIAKVGAQTKQAESATRKTDAEIAMDTAEFVGRDPTNRPAVIGAMRFAAQTLPAITPIIEKLEATQDPTEFATLTSKFSMTTKEAVDQKLNEQKFTEQQKQSGIDNDFQQGNLAVAQGGLAQRIHHDTVMENKPQAGFSMTTNPDGTATMSYGTPAKNELEKKVIGEEDALARLAEIEKSANSENLTYQNQAKNALLDVKSKLGGQMSPEQATFRDSMTDTRQVTLTNLNKTIHELSGTAMGVKEADRIMATMPNMDDAPDVFDRKLLNSTRMTREAIERHKGALGAAPPPNTPRTAVTAAPQPTQKDYEYTAAKHGITIEEVKRRLGAP